MPEGKSISFTAGEYPELDGLPAGSKVRLDVMGTVDIDESGNGTITFDSVGIEAEGMADRHLKEMTASSSPAYSASKGAGDDF